jgi:hypothetical protein
MFQSPDSEDTGSGGGNTLALVAVETVECHATEFDGLAIMIHDCVITNGINRHGD